MIQAEMYHAVRLLPRLTSVGMLVVIVLQVAGFINAGMGLVDVLTLAMIGVLSRLLLRAGALKPPS